MSNYAVVKNSEVVNIIVWNGSDAIEVPEIDELVEIKTNLSVSIGFTYKDGIFSTQKSVME